MNKIMKIKRYLTGAYHLFKNSRMVAIPYNPSTWSMFLIVCENWADGYPLLFQVGAFLSFDGPLSSDDLKAAHQLIVYNLKHTEKVLGLFQCYPDGKEQIIHHRYADPGVMDPVNGPNETLGWKQTYCWEPL